MAQILVRNIEADVKKKLAFRAARYGRSMEEEIRDILRNAVKEDARHSHGRVGSRIAALFADIGLDKEVPELRVNPIKLPSFD